MKMITILLLGLIVGILLVGSGCCEREPDDVQNVTTQDKSKIDDSKIPQREIVDRTYTTDTWDNKDGTYKKTYYSGAVNILWNNELIPVEDYLNPVVSGSSLIFNNPNGDKIIEFDSNYEKQNALSISNFKIEINSFRGGYYFTTDADTEVKSMEYELSSDYDFEFINNKLMINNISIDFGMAEEVQNITTTFNEKDSKLIFSIEDSKTGSLKMIDPVVRYEPSDSNVFLRTGEKCNNSGIKINNLDNPLNVCDSINADQSGDSGLSSSDNNDLILETTSTSWDNGLFFVFRFDISEPKNTIDSFNFTIEGETEDISDLDPDLYFWNVSNGEWIVYNVSGFEQLSDREVNFTTEGVGHNPSDLMNNSNSIHFAGINTVTNHVGIIDFRIDYAYLDVYYEEGDPTLNLTYPTTENTKSVSANDTITLWFNVTDYGGSILTSGVTWGNATVDGEKAYIHNNTVCSGTPSACGTFGNTGACANASCDWDSSSCANNGACGDLGTELLCSPACPSCTWTASCPYGYVWDGERYNFVNDLGAGGIMGLGFPPYPRNYNKIPFDIEPIDGYYLLKSAQENDELSYTDEIKILAIDHSDDVEIIPVFNLPYPLASGKISEDIVDKFYTVNKTPKKIISATMDGNDVTDLLLEKDGIYNKGKHLEFTNIELDLGELDNPEEVKLLMTAYTQWYANWQFNFGEMHYDYIEVINESGDWETTDLMMTLPYRFPMDYVIDLTDYIKTDDYRVRLNFWTKVNIDRIAVDTTITQDIKMITLKPESAEISFRGFASEDEIRLGTAHPVYKDPSKETPCGYYAQDGNFTRYGDVTELIDTIDDKFIIMASGDEISMKFKEVKKPIKEGMARTFVIRDWTYYKQPDDMPYEYSTEPYPFSAMSTYPYPDEEHYPDDKKHLDYIEEYNTREYREYLDDEDGLFEKILAMISLTSFFGGLFFVFRKSKKAYTILFSITLVCISSQIVFAPCSGTLSCPDYNAAQASCEACSVCLWASASCGGTPATCDTYPNQSSCSFAGCDWGAVDDFGLASDGHNWTANITVPTGCSGASDLWVDVLYDSEHVNSTETGAITCPGGDTCTCPGDSSAHEFDCSDECDVATCTAGDVTFTGSGFTRCGGAWAVEDLGDPGSGCTLWIDNDCDMETT